MKAEKLKVQNDILYLFLLLTVSEFFNFLVLRSELMTILLVGSLGIVLLETWFVRAFSIYSGKKISKYSDVIVRISFRERFFGYFILPLIFYVSLLVFLFFNRNLVLGHVVLGICMVLLLILFLNVKSSLNKLYSVENATRAIFDFICITILYLLVNVYIRMGLSIILFLVLIFISVLILLVFSLKLHDRLGWLEIFVSVLSSIFISFVTFVFWDFSIFVIPLVASLAFYLVVSLWNIRFSGKIRFSEYLLPFLYVALAIILILYI